MANRARVLGGGIVVVLEKRRVLYLDPEKADPRWQYACAADLVGRPQLIAGRLVLADAGGTITTLDAATGKASGPSVTLRPSVAPAAAPVPLGDGRLAVLLTDGTMIVLPPAS